MGKVPTTGTAKRRQKQARRQAAQQAVRQQSAKQRTPGGPRAAAKLAADLFDPNIDVEHWQQHYSALSPEQTKKQASFEGDVARIRNLQRESYAKRAGELRAEREAVQQPAINGPTRTEWAIQLREQWLGLTDKSPYKSERDFKRQKTAEAGLNYNIDHFRNLAKQKRPDLFPVEC